MQKKQKKNIKIKFKKLSFSAGGFSKDVSDTVRGDFAGLSSNLFIVIIINFNKLILFVDVSKLLDNMTQTMFLV